jgi:hypothetical protein
MKRLLALGLVVVAGCSSGVAAPTPVESFTDCTADFCLAIPDGWIVVNGGDYISAVHEDDPEHTFLTAAVIDLQAIVEASGGSWPARSADVSRAFWTLLEQADVGEFERSGRIVGGAERSWGTHEDGKMWHLIVPTGATSGIGVEIRAPNDSWEAHADVVFASVETP